MSTRRWVIAVAAAVLVTAVGLVVAQDQEVLRVRSPVAAADPAFPEYVAALLGAQVTSGDQYRVLQNGVEIFPAMFEAIRRAKHRISFESFIYADGEIAHRFTEAFAEAAQRGVTVRIVLDTFGAADLPDDSLERLQQAGVRVVWFNPVRPWTLEEANYRTHRKVLVVDGTVAFTGGVGLADHWKGDARNANEWRDTQFQITGPAVRLLEAAFYENWIESGGREAPALDAEPPPQGTGARSIVIWSNANSGASNVKLAYLLSIASARESIDIQSPYVILDRSTRWALDQARSRGVRVRILTEGSITDAKPVKFASRAAYDDLLEAGYEILEYAETMMHVKAMIVDDIWSVFGSANFDNRSFELNDELTVAVHDRALATTLSEAFARDVERSTALSLERWRDRPRLEKAREEFWELFGELF